MSAITLLHLSDIHFKKNKKDDDKIFRRDVQDKMLNAIKGHLDERQEVDFIVVTGDIAFSGKKEEYDEAEGFFERLKTIVPDKSEFLMVPGNHDVDREEVNELLSLQKNVVNEEKVEEFLREKKNISRIVNPKFEYFRKFARQCNSKLYKDESKYFWVRNVEDRGISFLGLNSSWACEGDEDRYNIALGYPQIKEALDLAGEMPVRIALMHHSHFYWLKDVEAGKCRSELFGKCRLLLHGHDHADRAEIYADPSHSIICLGANSSYTLDKQGYIGFQFVNVTLTGDSVSCRVWPYIFDDRRRHDFVPDRERYAAQKGEAFFDIHPYEYSSKESQKPIIPLRIPDDYRDWIERFHSKLPIEQLAKKGEVFHVPLPRVYIPLATANPFHKEEIKRLQAEKEKKRGKKGENTFDAETKEPPMIDIEELLGRQDTVLLRGEPGMGKTTLVRHLAYIVVHGQAKPGLQGYLPVLIFLKDLWPLFEAEIKKNSGRVEFESILEAYFEEIACHLTIDIVNGYLEQGRAILLIDGLDEVPEHLRGVLIEKISRFWSKNKTNRFLLTGRPHGITGEVTNLFGKYLQDIERLDQGKIAGFITDWYHEVCGQATGIAEKTATELIADISTNEYVSVFVQIPLLLTAVCILYQDNKKIPDQRADLYGRVVDNLLCKRFSDPADPDNVPRIEAFFRRLAFVMQEKHLKHMEPFGVKGILKEFYPQGGNEKNSEYNRRIDRRFDEIEPNCGLLKRQSSGEVEFFHLTFQEFLAAKYLNDQDLNFENYLSDPWWDEVILLYASLVSLERTAEGNKIVEKILKFNGEHKAQHHRFCLLGSNALRDMLSFKRSQDVVNLSRQNLKGVITSHEDPIIRLEAGEILGVFGDDRYLDFEMVEVPAGGFIRGSKKGKYYDDEEPARKIYLDTFLIGKYPVTNREFKEFVDSGGYEQEEFWLPEGLEFLKEDKITEPLYWRDRKWNGLNFPVVGVSWYECEAFCRWLSERTGNKYRLPTEAEWEKASRGTDGRVWPWGNEFDEKLCNYYDLGLGRTSSVGIFSGGESPYGCGDMAGNVWEWCQDWFAEDYYKKSPDRNPPGPKNGDFRVLRGGGWFNVSDYCRCAFRYGVVPSSRADGVGFRLARSL